MDLNQDQFTATEGKDQTVGISASLISLIREREKEKNPNNQTKNPNLSAK